MAVFLRIVHRALVFLHEKTRDAHRRYPKRWDQQCGHSADELPSGGSVEAPRALTGPPRVTRLMKRPLSPTASAAVV